MLPAGGFHHHFLSGLLAQQGLAEGGVLRDPAVHGVGLLGAHDLIGQGLVKLQVFHHHVVAHVDDVPGGLLLLDDGVVGQNLVQLCDAGVELTLLVLCLVILAVFRQVAEGAGLLDEFRHFLFPDGFQVSELLLEFFQALRAESIFLCHIQ